MPPVLAAMEKEGIKIDPEMLSRLSGDFAQRMLQYEEEAYGLAGKQFNIGSPKQLGEILFDELKLPGRIEDQDRRLVDGCDDPGRAGRAARSAAQDPGLAPALEIALDLHRSARPGRESAHRARAHQLRARLDDDGPALLQRSEPAEHSDPHRGRPAHPRGVHCRRRAMLLVSADYSPDRAPAAGARRRNSAAEARRSPTASTFTRCTASEMFGVPVQGMPQEIRSKRQGDQFRHHLRHFGVWPGAQSRHRARRGGRLHQEIFRALSGHSRLYGNDQDVRARQWLCENDLRAAHLGEGRAIEEPARARLRRTPGDQRAAAGRRRRHYPPRHGALAARRWRKRG